MKELTGEINIQTCSQVETTLTPFTSRLSDDTCLTLFNDLKALHRYGGSPLLSSMCICVWCGWCVDMLTCVEPY